MRKLNCVDLVLIAAAIGVLGFLPLHRRPAAAPVVVVQTNHYERAQRSTVLLKVDKGYGTGVVIRRIAIDTGKPRLFVWTAKHVVETSTNVTVIQVIHFDGRKVGSTTFTAKLLAKVPDTDAALLLLDAPESYFEPASWAPAAPPPIGAPVFHVGNLYGDDFDNSVTKGCLSQIGVKPSNPDWPWKNVDQYDLTIVPGSSGGPVFNDAGLILGLAVGGPLRGLDGIACVVPVREIEAASATVGLDWAIRGVLCPGDAMIQMAIRSREFEVQKLLAPSPVVPLMPSGKPRKK